MIFRLFEQDWKKLNNSIPPRNHAGSPKDCTLCMSIEDRSTCYTSGKATEDAKKERDRRKADLKTSRSNKEWNDRFMAPFVAIADAIIGAKKKTEDVEKSMGINGMGRS